MRHYAKLFGPTCRSLLAAAVFCVGASSALGQEADPRTAALIHLGPAYLTPFIGIKDVGVDTNVFNSADDKDKKRDFTITAAPHLDAVLPFGRRFDIKTTADADAVYYYTYSTQRSLGGSVSERGELRLAHVKLFASAAYGSSRRRPNLEIDARVRQLERARAGGVSVKISDRLSVDGGVETSMIQFDPDAIFLDTRLRDTLNRNSRAATASAGYALTPLTSIEIQAEAREDRFPYSADRDNRSLRFLPGVRFSPHALISGTAFVGYRRLMPAGSKLPAFRGAVGSVALSYTLYDSTMFAVTAARDLSYSFDALQPYYIANDVGVSVRRHIVGRFDGTIGMQHVRYDYRSFTDVTLFGLIPRQETTRNYFLALGAKLMKGSRLESRLGYWKRDSNVYNYRDFNGFRFMTSITRGF